MPAEQITGRAGVVTARRSAGLPPIAQNSELILAVSEPHATKVVWLKHLRTNSKWWRQSSETIGTGRNPTTSPVDTQQLAPIIA
jgi:hypothetical protein